MPYRKKSRINLELDLDLFKIRKKTKYVVRKNETYDWEKLLPSKIIKRNKWLGKIWAEIYANNPHDEFIRNLSTDDMYKTKWFEKYGYKEPNDF